jgi:hypothetical protein
LEGIEVVCIDAPPVTGSAMVAAGEAWAWASAVAKLVDVPELAPVLGVLVVGDVEVALEGENAPVTDDICASIWLIRVTALV